MELSEHDKQMLNVAEGGDPNDPGENLPPQDTNLPSENTGDETPTDENKGDYELPEGFDSVEELIEFYNNIPDDEEEAEELEEGDESDSDESEESEELTQLREAARERAVFDVVGGEEKYAELTEWARDNAAPEQLEVYNQAVTEGSPEVAAFAAQALASMHELATLKAHGQQGELTFPGQTNQMPTGITPYESDFQMTQDMNDPRYKTDPAFRQKVTAKIAASL